MTETSGADSDSDGSNRSARSETRGRNRVDDPIVSVIDALQRMWIKMKQFYNYVMVDMGGYIALEKSMQWCRQNPHKSILILGMAVTFSLPLLIGLVFGLSTITMMLTGFLVLEGALFSMLFVCLGTLAAVLIGFILFISFIYFGFSHIFNEAFGTSENVRTIMINYLGNAEGRNRRAPETFGANRNGGGDARNVAQNN